MYQNEKIFLSKFLKLTAMSLFITLTTDSWFGRENYYYEEIKINEI